MRRGTQVRKPGDAPATGTEGRDNDSLNATERNAGTTSGEIAAARRPRWRRFRRFGPELTQTRY